MAYTYRLIKDAPLSHAEVDDNFSLMDTQYDAAVAAAALAEQWAEEPEDSEVEAGSYSALHWAAKAQAAIDGMGDELTLAEAARDAAEGHATDAQTYAEATEGYRDQAEGYKDDAAGSATSAEEWARNPEDSEVEPGFYSSLHYAAKAEEDALAAESAETGAVDAKNDAETAQGLAEDAQTGAETAETNAQAWAAEDEDVEVSGGLYSALHYAAKASDDADTADDKATIATAAANAAEVHKLKAQDWAEEDEDVEVEAGLYSSKHYAAKSESSALAAQTFENNAESYSEDAEAWANEDEDVEVQAGEYSAKHYAAKAEGSASDANDAAEEARGLTIAILGDSLSQSMMFNKTWGQQLQDICNQGGLKITVKNWAVSSHTFYLARTEDAHENGTRTQVEQCIAHGADIVFVALGINDTVHENTRTEAQIIGDAEDVYDELKTGLPDAQIVLVRQDPHDTESKGLTPASLDNEDTIPHSHADLSYLGEDCRVNNNSYMTQAISGTQLDLHQMWGNVIDDISTYYDDVVTVSMWKLARLGCIIDAYHVDFWGHQLWAFSVLKWLKTNNGYDDAVLDIGLWETANASLVDVDEIWSTASANPSGAAHIARYHDLDLPQRMSSWMYKQRGFMVNIAPDSLQKEHNLTVIMSGAKPSTNVWFGWDSDNLADTGKSTTEEGKYVFAFAPEIVGGIDLTAGNHTCAFAVPQADGTYDVYEREIAITATPAEPLGFGDALFARKGSSTQTIADADTFETITWGTSLVSDGHDTSTVFTAPVDGLYRFHINMRFDWLGTPSTFAGLALVVNKGDVGEIYHTMPMQYGSGAYDHLHIDNTHDIILDEDDEVTSCFYQGGDDGIELLTDISSYSGYLVRNLS